VSMLTQGLALVHQLSRSRNRLDTNLEACLLEYVQDLFITATFFYEEAQDMLKSCTLTTGCIKLLKELKILHFFFKQHKKQAIWILSFSKRYKKIAKMHFIAC
jgi:hypothetical protein